MGSYTFKWPHGDAKEVLVTGTFDNWQKSVPLERKGDTFEKTVELPKTDEKILYKYVVDGEWTFDSNAPQERDDKNIVNNVLTPADIVASSVGAGFISSVAPGASTAAMAGAVPKETTSKNKKKKKKNKKNGGDSGSGQGSGQDTPVDPTIQSAAPTSSTAALAGAVPKEPRSGGKAAADSDPTISSVAPGSSTAAMAGAISNAPGAFPETPQEEPKERAQAGDVTKTPGAFPETPQGELKEADSLAKSGEPEAVSVNPIPATGGIGNPVKLAPGEKVPDPSTITDNTIDSTVRTDKASYEAGSAGSAVPSSEREPQFSGKPVPAEKDEEPQFSGKPVPAEKDKEPTFGVAPIPASAGIGNPILLKPGETVPDADTLNKARDQTVSVNPIPATAGIGNPIKLAPGEKVPDPSTITDNTVGSTVRTDQASYEAGAAAAAGTKEKEPTFSVNPIPATAGTGNPIKLAPGEKVPDPSTITNNTVSSTVRTDKAGYEASDAGPASDISKSLNTQGGAFGVPPVTSNLIPESSLPIVGGATGDPTIKSAAPTSSSAALAGAVPKEPRGVPEVVAESQSLANAPPEASSSAEAVREKSQVEKELQSKVPAKESETKPASGLPATVVQSLDKAHSPHEAADNPTAVQEKAAVERELTKDRKPVQAAGEPAPQPDPARLSQPPTIPTNAEERKRASEQGKSPAGAIAAAAGQRSESTAEAAAPTPEPTPQKTPSQTPSKPASSPQVPLSPDTPSAPNSEQVAAAGSTMAPPGIPGTAPVPAVGGAAPAPVAGVSAVGSAEAAKPAAGGAADVPATTEAERADTQAVGKKKRRSLFKRIMDKLKN